VSVRQRQEAKEMLRRPGAMTNIDEFALWSQ
jgi:hypothetical protein